MPGSGFLRSILSSLRKRPASMGVNVLTATAKELQKLLEARLITSVEIIKTYLAQIEKHNLSGMKLRALVTIQTGEKLLDQARDLDDERIAKGPRGPFHGIPIIVKV